jgi:RimJ/RimL family protein N-acetyltransferase
MVLRHVPLRLRPVRRADAQMLWRWANDPEVRAASFSSEPIAWEAHVTWLENRLRDPNTLFFIAIDGEDRPIGQIRFDVAGREAVVSVTVDRPFRHAGLGSRLIALASARAFRERPIEVVRAYVKPANTASMQAFVRAGYLEAGTVQVRGEEVRQFLLTSQRATHA